MKIDIFSQLPVLGLFFLFGNYFAYDPATCIQCRESHMCNPPDCFCCRDKMPLQTHSIPQMVFFTFDDAVNPQVANYYRQLFSPKRTNPNGCPITMTLFVSHRNTVYGLVKEFYEKGMEIASHSVTHSHMNANTFIREAKKQKENLSKRAGIPSDKIVGWRSPFLEPVGDLQPSVLKDLGYEYDATLTMAKKDPKDKAVTPFTLDFGWPYDCKIKPCPTRSHKGFWEVPVVSVKDYLDKYDCVYVDGCNNPPPTEDLAYKFLWDNFQKYYTTNRAPMGINMHASWFYYPERKAAMDRFIKKLVKIDDVYIVSVKQVIEWLRNPASLQEIKSFPPWQCNGNTTSPSQTGSNRFGRPPQRQRSRENAFRPQNTRIGNFIANVPQPSFPSRPWQQTRQPQRRPTFVPTTIPAPVPPMVPNLPMVRFWWRPPAMVDPAIQRSRQMQEQQRQETMRRRRLEEEKLRRMQAEEQARILEQQRQEELRQQELKRQADLLKRQKELERKRLEELQLRRRKQQELEKQRQLEEEQRKKAEEARIKELRRKELVKRQEIDRNRQNLAKQQQLASIDTLQHENEFLQVSEISNQQASATFTEQPLFHTMNSQNFQDNLINNEQLQAEIAQQWVTQTTKTTTPSTTIDHQKVLEKSFKKFISMKLDEILGYRPGDRTKQLELLSIAELRALQEELRNRLVSENLSDTKNQSKPAQTVSGLPLSDSITDSQPIQNEIHLESKPMLNEFHLPVTIERTKLNEYQSQVIVQPDTSKQFNIPAKDSVTIEKSTTATTSTATAESSTKELTRTIIPTTQPETSTFTIPTTTTNPTTQSTTTTTTTTTTTKPPTTTITSSPVSTEKARIPVVQRWTVLQNMDGPWQRWMTERPGMTELHTTAPEVREPKNSLPSGAFNSNNIQKIQPLFNKQAMDPFLSTSDSLNELTVDQVIENAMTDNVNKGNQQPKAFVNAPMHFDINYDIDRQSQADLFGGISFNTNRFMSPFNNGFGRIHIQAPDIHPDTTTTSQSSRTNAETTFLPTTIQPTTTTTTPTTTTTTTTTTTASTTTPTTTTTTTTTTTPPPPTTTITTTTTQTTTTTTTKATTQPKHTTQSNQNVFTNVHFKIPDNNMQLGNQQSQPGSNVHFLAQDLNAYFVSGTNASDMTEQTAETLPPSKQILYLSPTPNTGRLSASSKCIQEVNCMRPDCVCKETNSPNRISLSATPQIVYITVDGSLNFHTYGKMRSLFSRSRKNPNGCRIKGTVFVTDTGSSYRIANVLKNDGVELAMMGVSSRPYTDSEKMKQDLILQRKRISMTANIPLNEVKGWRSPGFSPVGDKQFNILANQSLYDSSLILHADARDLPIPWPHTLDFGWDEPCEVGTCPRNNHGGVWEVPALPFNGPNNTTACEYIDACTVQPETKQETLDYLMDNFNAYYKTNKAPFAIRLKQIWFHWYYRENFAGLLMFLDKILGFGDVYITSVADTIEWMKSPKPLTELKQFEKWKC